jgi:hypothetical protein
MRLVCPRRVRMQHFSTAMKWGCGAGTRSLPPPMPPTDDEVSQALRPVTIEDGMVSSTSRSVVADRARIPAAPTRPEANACAESHRRNRQEARGERERDGGGESGAQEHKYGTSRPPRPFHPARISVPRLRLCRAVGTSASAAIRAVRSARLTAAKDVPSRASVPTKEPLAATPEPAERLNPLVPQRIHHRHSGGVGVVLCWAT